MSERKEEPTTSSSEPADMGDPSGVATTEQAEGGASDQTASLLSLIDRLGSLLEKSDLVEIEVEAGETGIILRKPAALAPVVVSGVGGSAADTGPAPAPAPAPSGDSVPSTLKVVRAPLTGVYYNAASPTSPPFVTVGQKIDVGHVIGLIEAMKLFNEIKSDQAGRVVRIVAEAGKLVKAKQPLIEVEPA
jgi:acetyl-CoA carboxylase biotin carboxyl carrier protein